MRKSSELYWASVGVSAAQLEKRGAAVTDEFGPDAWDIDGDDEF